MEADLSFSLLESSNFFNNYLNTLPDQQSLQTNNLNNDLLTLENEFAAAQSSTNFTNFNGIINNDAINVAKTSKSNKKKAKKPNENVSSCSSSSSNNKRVKGKLSLNNVPEAQKTQSFQSIVAQDNLSIEPSTSGSGIEKVKKRVRRYCPDGEQLEFCFRCEWDDCGEIFVDTVSFFCHIEQHIHMVCK